MQIREAAPEEYEAIGELTVAAYREVSPLGGYEDELRAVARHAASCTVLVAIDRDGALLGSVTYVPGPGTPMSEFTDPDAAGIRVLAVDPTRQGAGTGRSLTEACIDRARAAGRRRIILHSTQYMTVARGMYERMGFSPVPALGALVTDPPFSVSQPLELLAYVLEL